MKNFHVSKPTARDVLEESGQLLVGRAIERDDAISDAVLELMAGTQVEWTLDDWENLRAEGLANRNQIRVWLKRLPPKVAS